MNEILIYGAGGHAKVVADTARLLGFHVVGFIDNANPNRRGEKFFGSTVLGGESIASAYAGACGVVAFGNCAARLEKATWLQGQGLRTTTLVHPRAIVAEGCEIGNGTVIAAGVVVQPGCKIGEAVILNTACSIDHDCSIEDGAHICPGVTIAGGCFIGKAAWVGVGATVSDHKRIGAGAMIGAGSVVVRDVLANVVAYGVPARVMRKV